MTNRNALHEALENIEKAIDHNDGDTLCSLTPDTHVIFTGSCSWTGSHSITLGDLRAIAKNKDLLESAIQEKPVTDTPQGMVCVPLEPTKRMIEAGFSGMTADIDNEKIHLAPITVWEEMIAAYLPEEK